MAGTQVTLRMRVVTGEGDIQHRAMGMFLADDDEMATLSVEVAGKRLMEVGGHVVCELIERSKD